MPDDVEQQPPVKPRWAPKVLQRKLRRLYEQDARGILEEVLLDDVGIGLYLRGRSMLAVHAVMIEGRIPCPWCAQVFVQDRRTLRDPTTVLRCPACGWCLPWGDYHRTFQHQELIGAGGNPFIAEFVAAWPAARTAREKLLLIDRLLHLWHWQESPERGGVGRPTGVNFIEGGRNAVIAFLDTLTYGEATAPELHEHAATWRAHLHDVRESTARWHAARGAKSLPGREMTEEP